MLEFIVAFSTRMGRKAFNAVVSHFLKDVLDRFAITSVNDELVASAAPLAVKHALPSSQAPFPASRGARIRPSRPFPRKL
ncbi:MAG: hypothetical protein QXP36_03915 [Conexivisphaerales archaeon]